jgi:hypothetical protein
MCQNLDLQFLSFIAFVNVFPRPFSLFHLAFYCIFSFFDLIFYHPLFPPFFFAHVLSRFFFPHVVSSLTYPNLLGNKRLGCCCLL